MRPEGGGTEISTRCEIVVSRAIVKAVLTGHQDKRHREGHRSQNSQCGLLQTGREQHNQFNHPGGILISAQ